MNVWYVILQVFIFLWNNVLEKALEKIVQNSEGKLDDYVLKAVKKLIDVFLPKIGDENEQRGPALDAIKILWECFVEEFKTLDYKTILYNFYQSFLKKILIKFKDRYPGEFDDSIIVGINKLVDTFLKPKNQIEGDAPPEEV